MFSVFAVCVLSVCWFSTVQGFLSDDEQEEPDNETLTYNSTLPQSFRQSSNVTTGNSSYESDSSMYLFSLLNRLSKTADNGISPSSQLPSGNDAGRNQTALLISLVSASNQSCVAGGRGGRGRRRSCRPKDLGTDAFFVRLGPDFNGTWMSVEAPSYEQPNDTMVQRSNDSERYRSDTLPSLNFTYIDKDGAERQMKPSVRRHIRKWLVERYRTSCPLRLTWYRMSDHFWPRWLRIGVCDAAVSCSLPPGMYCKDAGGETLRLLQWKCAAKQKQKTTTTTTKKMKRCDWYKVPIIVTTGCACSC